MRSYAPVDSEEITHWALLATSQKHGLLYIHCAMLYYVRPLKYPNAGPGAERVFARETVTSRPPPSSLSRFFFHSFPPSPLCWPSAAAPPVRTCTPPPGNAPP